MSEDPSMARIYLRKALEKEGRGGLDGGEGADMWHRVWLWDDLSNEGRVWRICGEGRMNRAAKGLVGVWAPWRKQKASCE